MSDNTRHQVLIVDDEADIRELLTLTLGRMGVEARSAETVSEARGLLASRHFQLCLTDMRLPDGNGIELVRHIQQHHPRLPVAMFSAHGNMDTAVEALKAGAFDFISKPVELQALRELISYALRLTDADSATEPDEEQRLVGDSEGMARVRQMVHKLARSQAPVYISGESGTGKELVARLIHALGPRAEGPFVAVNCGAIPASLMESELFGHRKGSFTGAHSDKEGLFQAANGGTLFLDEVADLPLEMQVKLLRALQEKAVRAVGAQKEDHIDVRILSATHKNLIEMVRERRFRDDLFYRINVIELPLPPLRERRGDITQLVGHLLGKQADEQGFSPAPRLSSEALAVLEGYDFPGNIRELENILERALTLSDGQQIEVADLALPVTVATQPPSGETQAPMPTAAEASPFDGGQELAEVEALGLENYLEQIERRLIRQALEKSRYNKTAAAKRLGISFRSFRYRLQKLGLEQSN